MIRKTGLAIIRLIRRRPRLYLIWFYLYRSRRGVRVARPSEFSKLHLDGYPRSGNTYSANLIKNLLPGMRERMFVHHLHAVAPLMLSSKYGTPILVLIRNPKDAIASNYLKYFALRNIRLPNALDGELVWHEIQSYIDFYRYVRRHKARIHIVEFDKMISEPIAFLTLALHLLGEDGRTITKDAVDRVESDFRAVEKRKNPLGSSLPNTDRAQATERVASALYGFPEFAECETLYKELTS